MGPDSNFFTSCSPITSRWRESSRNSLRLHLEIYTITDRLAKVSNLAFTSTAVTKFLRKDFPTSDIGIKFNWVLRVGKPPALQVPHTSATGRKSTYSHHRNQIQIPLTRRIAGCNFIIRHVITREAAVLLMHIQFESKLSCTSVTTSKMLSKYTTLSRSRLSSFATRSTSSSSEELSSD